MVSDMDTYDMDWLINEVRRLKSEKRLLQNKIKGKRKLEFMQKLCIASWILMSVTIFADLLLAWFEKQPIPSTTQAVIGFVSVFFSGGYVTQNIIRNCSLNKHGMRIPNDGGGKYYLPKPTEDGYEEAP